MDESIKLALEEKDDIYDRIIKENINDRKIVVNCDINDDLLENLILYIILPNL